MPVWHAATSEARAAGDLQVVGITQEQHPRRCRLFAQWKGIDWPILWDPFNLTGSKVVPRFVLVDEHGVVRNARARPSDLEAFLRADHPVPPALPRPPKGPRDRVVEAMGNDAADEAWDAVSHLLFARGGDPSPSVAALERAAELLGPTGDPDPAALFRLGVARRMRYDTPHPRADDFQGALTAWAGALRAKPDQYVWRRRIQQYGPKPDKPYPFYAWVEHARAAIRARGESPTPLLAPLTETERNVWARAEDDTAPPDPDGHIPRDEEDLLQTESAVAFDTSGRLRAAEVHVVVRPTSPGKAVWSTEGEKAVLWLDPPDGWTLDRRRLERRPEPGGDGPEDLARPLAFEVGIRPTRADAKSGVVTGYVLCPVCLAEDGTCVLLRQDVRIPISVPAPR